MSSLVSTTIAASIATERWLEFSSHAFCVESVLYDSEDIRSRIGENDEDVMYYILCLTICRDDLIDLVLEELSMGLGSNSSMDLLHAEIAKIDTLLDSFK